MSTVFNTSYSDAYDTIYSEKDYDGECALLERIFSKYSEIPISSVLDLGCGTGGHSIRLAEKGYEITGIDISPSMLSHALQKAKERNLNIRFHLSSIIDLDLKKEFDYSIMMFAVLGYHYKNNEILSALKNIRRHLKNSGVLVFDVWYGPAVLNQKPSDKFFIKKEGEKQVIRTSTGRLDTFTHTCDVEFNLWEINNNSLISQTREIHKMRYFFPQEIKLFLSIAGFKMLYIGAFSGFESNATDETWNVVVVAKRE